MEENTQARTHAHAKRTHAHTNNTLLPAGILECANGSSYEGEWKDGKMHGRGASGVKSLPCVTRRVYDERAGE